jgi:hypothetical protein
MRGMKTSMKTSLIIIALVLLACLVVLRSRSDEPFAASGSDTSQGPSFEVHVVKPLSAQPLFGLFKLFGLLPDNELRFDQTSRGAEIGSVGPDRLELSADGWDLFIETDGEGRVAPGTRLVFPIELGGRQVRLRCRPADGASGYLRTTTRAGSDELDGLFLVKLATCENAESGKAIEWPPAPLTVNGSFKGLPHDRR